MRGQIQDEVKLNQEVATRASARFEEDPSTILTAAELITPAYPPKSAYAVIRRALVALSPRDPTYPDISPLQAACPQPPPPASTTPPAPLLRVRHPFRPRQPAELAERPPPPFRVGNEEIGDLPSIKR